MLSSILTEYTFFLATAFVLFPEDIEFWALTMGAPGVAKPAVTSATWFSSSHFTAAAGIVVVAVARAF